jgi:hypothetical protein
MARYRRVARKAAPVVKPDLSTLTKAELVSLAEERGIDSSGTKADLIARLT